MPLLELIHQLPRASRFNEAQLNDPDVAAELAAYQLEQERDPSAPKAEWAPDVRDWDLHAQLLREVRETLVAVHSAIWETTYVPAGEGRQKALRAPRVSALPSPQTAVDRIKADLTRQRQLEIVALFAPHALDMFT